MTDPSPWRPTNYRAERRNRAHDEADASQAPPPAHDLVPQGKAALVTTQRGLGELVDALRAAGTFAYDSEFIGELTYFPRLCLIQAATADRVALVDPLADLDLTPFWQLIADPAVEKIVHAGEQDLEPVVRLLNVAPANVLDTQVAAGLVGLSYPVSLSRLVQELVGYRLGKGHTFSNWDQRPLSAQQLRYAADDVRYLPAVHAELTRRLRSLGHLDWAREECANGCAPALHTFDPDTQYLRVRGATSLTPVGLAVLRELVRWRNAAARNADVPPRAFLRDEILIDLSRQPIKSVERLDRVRGLPRPVEQHHGHEILAATQRALATPADALPQQRATEESAQERFRTDSLYAAAQAIAAGRSFDAALVTSRNEIAELLRRTAGGQTLVDLRLMTGWRRDALGQPLLDLLQGSRTFTLSWSDGLRTA